MNFFVFIVFVLFASCSSREQQRQQGLARQEVKTVDQGLKVGMSFEDVKQLSNRVGNCKGSSKSYQRCEMTFMTTAAKDSWPSQSTGPYTDVYTKYLLHFEKDRLTRWEKGSDVDAR